MRCLAAKVLRGNRLQFQIICYIYANLVPIRPLVNDISCAHESVMPKLTRSAPSIIGPSPFSKQHKKETWPKQGYSSQKSIDFLLNPFCIKLVTIHFSACNFAIVYLYKESLNQGTKVHQKNSRQEPEGHCWIYSKTCVKRPLKKTKTWLSIPVIA